MKKTEIEMHNKIKFRRETAARAMQGIIASGNIQANLDAPNVREYVSKGVAANAVLYADALIKELEK